MKNLAMAVVVRNSKVLVQHRFRKSIGMVYEFPGGSIDKNEQPQQAAIRELNEETGLSLTEVLGTHCYLNEEGGQIYFVLLSGLENKEPSALDPVRKQAFYWFGHAEIPLSDFYNSDKQFIDSVLQRYM